VSAGRELVDVVDDDDHVVGRATRAEMRRDNLLHRAVYILVWSTRGELFVHQRTPTKDVYPAYWDVTVGGVVGAGEGYDEAARRELAEEIGVRCEVVEPLFAVRYRDAATQLIGRAYLARHDGPFRLQVEEIVSGGFVSLAAAERIMRDEPCCPDGVAVLRRYLEERTATTS
jgi:isopentenyldiphosphate isomerase